MEPAAAGRERGAIDAIDARTDVYALGAMLYEVLSGRPPYVGPNGLAVLRQVLEGPPDPTLRAVRGGTWINDHRFARIANRGCILPDNRFPFIGFRLACRPRSPGAA